MVGSQSGDEVLKCMEMVLKRSQEYIGLAQQHSKLHSYNPWFWPHESLLAHSRWTMQDWHICKNKVFLVALLFSSTSPSSCPPAVSSRADQPHPEVGGCVEGAGLPGTQCVLRRARGERTLTEICPLGTACSLRTPNIFFVLCHFCVFKSAINPFCPSVLFVCSTPCQSIQGILPFSPAEVPYCGLTRSVCTTCPCQGVCGVMN